MVDIDTLVPEGEWPLAEELYRAGEPRKLTQLLRSSQPIPDKQRRFLADVLEGKVRPASRAGRSSKDLTYEQKLRAYETLRAIRWLREGQMRDRAYLSDECGVDISVLKQYWSRVRQSAIAELAAEYGINGSSIVKAAQRFAKQDRVGQ